MIGLEDMPEEWQTKEETIDPETGEVVQGADGKPLMRTVFDMQKVVDHCVDVILAREKMGNDSFVAIISEGIAEFLPIAEIRKCISDDEYRSLKPDSFGHFPVSQLKYSSRLGRLIAEEYKKRTGKPRKMVGLQFGYEVRCNAPTAYDVILGSQIGVGCYRALCEKNISGVMISVQDTMNLSYPVFEDLINMEKLRAYQRPVKVGSDLHQMARYLEAWTE